MTFVKRAQTSIYVTKTPKKSQGINVEDAGLEPTTMRLIGGHAAISARWFRVEVDAIRTKSESFKGGNKSPNNNCLER